MVGDEAYITHHTEHSDGMFKMMAMTHKKADGTGR
jgi:hypothetical protein